MAKARPSITRRGCSLSLPPSLPKTNEPAGISISGFPAIGSSPATAPALEERNIRAKSTLEIDTLPALRVEQEHPLGREPDAHRLIEIADEVLVGAHGQQCVAGTDADQRAFAR